MSCDIRIVVAVVGKNTGKKQFRATSFRARLHRGVARRIPTARRRPARSGIAPAARRK
jgi:hypothetical protein